MYKTTGFARKSLGGTFEKIDIERNEVGPEDVEFEIKYCGICHSDVHIADNLFGATKYPIIPGHELAGIVCKVISKFWQEYQRHCSDWLSCDIPTSSQLWRKSLFMQRSLKGVSNSNKLLTNHEGLWFMKKVVLKVYVMQADLPERQ